MVIIPNIIIIIEITIITIQTIQTIQTIVIIQTIATIRIIIIIQIIIIQSLIIPIIQIIIEIITIDIINEVMINVIKNIDRFTDVDQNDIKAQIVAYSRNASINLYKISLFQKEILYFKNYLQFNYTFVII